ncbi:hypothetical protein BD311DRAFT_758429 [Dichomitus squalens]|uniref:Uncharacterized protein n=1 Tax=Dichomitus squalens TaxID=114155 RepID=A0A4V2K0E6_9APHY|nr:hypothetical protein BD311DRAFT_758429 [Dichomitus squalens]
MAGYFAFPPPGSAAAPLAFRQTLGDTDVNILHSSESQRQPQERSQSAERKPEAETQAQAQAQRQQTEREQIRLGEMEWVRAGGWLRDASGRKDKARTEQVRAEVRLVDEERRTLERWDAYEARWNALLSSTTSVTFADIPWPASPPPSSAEDLASDVITEFFLGPLLVRSSTVLMKDRIRTSILRWHPDKLSAIVSRTVEGDLDSVRAGINTVFHVLRSLQDLERNLDIPA